MGLSARFGADFTEILYALSAVELKVNSAAEKANQATPQFSRLVNEFNGSTLEKNAAMMVAAIDKVGDVTKLTSSEQAKANAVLQQYIDKARVMGAEVPPHMQEIANATKQATVHTKAITDQTSLYGDVLKKASGWAAATFTAGAILDYLGSIVELGDQIQAMADKTGMSAEQVQKLGYIAQQSGLTVDDMATAAQNLQQRLGDNDAGATGALNKLGVNAKNFIALNTYQQMQTLADAIQAIPDPTMRASVAADLFGKSWKAIMPALVSDFNGLAGAAPTMSNETVAALDRAGDSWDAFKTTVKVSLATAWDKSAEFVANLATALDKGEDVVTSFQKIWLGLRDDFVELPKVTPPVKTGVDGVALSMAEAEKVGAKLDDQVKAQIETNKKAAEEWKKLKSEMDAMSGQKLIANTNELVATYDRLVKLGLKPTYEEQVKLNKAITDASEAAQENGRAIPDAWDKVTLASSSTRVGIKGVVYDLGSYAVSVPPAVNQTDEINAALNVLASRSFAVSPAMSEAEEALTRMAGNMPEVRDQTDQINQAFKDLAEEKAKKMKEALGDVSDALGGVSRVAEMSGNKTVAAVASIASTTIQAFTQGGPVAGAIAFVTSLFVSIGNSLFKVEERKVNDLRDAFVASQGGLSALAEEARKAGLTLDALLAAKKVDDFNAAVAALNKGFEKTTAITAELKTKQEEFAALSNSSWQNMEAAAKKYGIELGSLGEKFQANKLHDSWLQILNDYELLEKNGADVGAVLYGMREEISALVVDSIKFGVAIPAQFKPFVEQLAASGNLLDENGKAITDLSKLSFGAALVSQFDGLIKKIQDLIDTLNGVGTSSKTNVDRVIENLNRIPGERIIKIKYDDSGNDGSSDGGNGSELAVAGYATGTQGRFIDFGSGTPVMLHGRERVVTEREAASGGGGSIDTAGLQARLEAIEQLLAEQAVTQPLAIGRAVRDAVLTMG